MARTGDSHSADALGDQASAPLDTLPSGDSLPASDAPPPLDQLPAPVDHANPDISSAPDSGGALPSELPQGCSCDSSLDVCTVGTCGAVVAITCELKDKATLCSCDRLSGNTLPLWPAPPSQASTQDCQACIWACYEYGCCEGI